MLCRTPDSARFTIAQATLPLYSGWNLVSSSVEPDNPAIATVQRPIAGTYSAIFAWLPSGTPGGSSLWYYPSGPDHGALSSVHSGLGYWIKETLPPPPAEEQDESELPTATLNLVGQRRPQDGGLALAAGWNLAGYLPQVSLPVTGALSAIDGGYASVLGFSGTAVSYYADLEPGYNTLWSMLPGAGYWISATNAVTLQYPAAGIAMTPGLSETRRPYRNCVSGRHPGRRAGRRGAPHLHLGQPVRRRLPAGRQPGAHQRHRYRPGQRRAMRRHSRGERGPLRPARLLRRRRHHAGGGRRPAGRPYHLPGGRRSGRGTAGQLQRTERAARGVVRWTALGDRWQVEVGAPPVVDVAIAKTVAPTLATPGSTITYTLVYSNAGNRSAQGVVIADRLPVEIEQPALHAGRQPVWRPMASPA